MSYQNDFPGQRLGLAADGSGSIARMGRRIGAICIDWAIATLFSVAFFKYDANISLLFFFVEQCLLVSTLGYSIGHRVFGIAVRRLDGKWVGFWRGFIRTGLICIVIPVAIWDADQRGLHDKAVGTVLVRL